MNEQQKKMRDFFAEKIQKKLTWEEEDTQAMLDLLDPVWPNSTPLEEARHLAERARDFAREFAQWEAKQPQAAEPVKPMTDKEIDDLAILIR